MLKRSLPVSLPSSKLNQPPVSSPLATLPTASLRRAAQRILEEEGLAALSLRSVARRAGVSHAAPYRHYPSREALLADVAVEGLRALRSDIGSQVGLTRRATRRNCTLFASGALI